MLIAGPKSMVMHIKRERKTIIYSHIFACVLHFDISLLMFFCTIILVKKIVFNAQS